MQVKDHKSPAERSSSIGSPSSIQTICKTGHVLSVCYVSSFLIHYYLFDERSRQKPLISKIIYDFCGILMNLTGVILMYLLKARESMAHSKYMLWRSIADLKLLFSVVIFTPIMDAILTDESTRNYIQSVFLVILLFASVPLRILREYYPKQKEN